MRSSGPGPGSQAWLHRQGPQARHLTSSASLLPDPNLGSSSAPLPLGSTAEPDVEPHPPGISALSQTSAYSAADLSMRPETLKLLEESMR